MNMKNRKAGTGFSVERYMVKLTEEVGEVATEISDLGDMAHGSKKGSPQVARAMRRRAIMELDHVIDLATEMQQQLALDQAAFDKKVKTR